MPEDIERQQAMVEARNADMRETVEITKDLGLPAAIRQFELRIEHGYGDVVLDNAKRRMERSKSLLENDPNKESEMQTAQEIMTLAERWPISAPKILEFLKQVHKGELPQNWLDKPDWSLEGYPYEGIYRHNVIRWSTTMMLRLRKAGINPDTATEDQKKQIAEEIIREEPWLKRKEQP